ncbi:hypothetical protein Tco_0425641 [Tanacetum coccineum]
MNSCKKWSTKDHNLAKHLEWKFMRSTTVTWNYFGKNRTRNTTPTQEFWSDMDYSSWRTASQKTTCDGVQKSKEDGRQGTIEEEQPKSLFVGLSNSTNGSRLIVFDVEGDYANKFDDPYSRRFDEYKKVFNNEVEQLSNEYILRIGKKGGEGGRKFHCITKQLDAFTHLGRMQKDRIHRKLICEDELEDEDRV